MILRRALALARVAPRVTRQPKHEGDPSPRTPITPEGAGDTFALHLAHSLETLTGSEWGGFEDALFSVRPVEL